MFQNVHCAHLSSPGNLCIFTGRPGSGASLGGRSVGDGSSVGEAQALLEECGGVGESLGVSLIRKLDPRSFSGSTQSPIRQRFKVAAAVALVEQEAEDSIRSRFDMTGVWEVPPPLSEEASHRSAIVYIYSSPFSMHCARCVKESESHLPLMAPSVLCFAGGDQSGAEGTPRAQGGLPLPTI